MIILVREVYKIEVLIFGECYCLFIVVHLL